MCVEQNKGVAKVIIILSLCFAFKRVSIAGDLIAMVLIIIGSGFSRFPVPIHSLIHQSLIETNSDRNILHYPVNH